MLRGEIDQIEKARRLAVLQFAGLGLLKHGEGALDWLVSRHSELLSKAHKRCKLLHLVEIFATVVFYSSRNYCITLVRVLEIVFTSTYLQICPVGVESDEGRGA